MNEKMTKSLQALFRATASKYPDKGLIAHPDQGGQYCAHDYQDLLQQFGMVTYQWSTLLTAHLTDGCEHALEFSLSVVLQQRAMPSGCMSAR